MDKTEDKIHWEKIYQKKEADEVSWYQKIPEKSLKIFKDLKIEKNSSIIDIGAGDSTLVDCLTEIGFVDISIVDISQIALNKTRNRIGSNSVFVNFIEADIRKFKPEKIYDVWHDRACFHFLTDEKDINHYKTNIVNNIKTGGYFVLSTFSESGPVKCSGLDVTRYSVEKISNLLKSDFELLESFETEHHTPFNSIQNFIYFVFRKL